MEKSDTEQKGKNMHIGHFQLHKNHFNAQHNCKCIKYISLQQTISHQTQIHLRTFSEGKLISSLTIIIGFSNLIKCLSIPPCFGKSFDIDLII